MQGAGQIIAWESTFFLCFYVYGKLGFMDYGNYEK